MASKYEVDGDEQLFGGIDDSDDVIGLDFEGEQTGQFQYRKLSEAEEKACRDCFDFFDKDRNGKMDKKELAKAMRAVGLNPTKKEVEKIMKYMDENRNGFIDWEEFKQIMARSWKSSRQTELEMVAAFRMFDTNKDGYITCEELRTTLSTFGEKMSPEEAEYFVKMADVDNDGKINYKEFVHVMCGEGLL